MGNSSSIPGDCCRGLSDPSCDPNYGVCNTYWCNYTLPPDAVQGLSDIQIQKLNGLVNVIRCASTPQDIINQAANNPKLAVVLCLPPALPFVYSIKAINGSCSRTQAPVCSQNSGCTGYSNSSP